MSIYTIRDLETLSGVKAHTIRIWELRYKLLVPNRTDSNIRRYSDDQMRKLLNITTLLHSGMKISHIAELSDAAMLQQVELLASETTPPDTHAFAIINQMIASGLAYDEQLLEKAFSNALMRFNLKDTYASIVYPVLVRVGMMWASEEMMPAQEHFISSLIKRKLNAAIDLLPAPSSAAEKWLLYLPEEESHEIGLLLSAFLLRQSGKHVIYLGQRVPFSNLSGIIHETQPEVLHFFFVRYYHTKVLQDYINLLKHDFPKLKVRIAGSDKLAEGIKLPANYQWINSIDSFLKII